MPDINNMVPGSGRILKENNTTVNVGNILESFLTNGLSLSGDTLQEQKTQADAVVNVITFEENITFVEIIHNEVDWQTFVVNGIALTVPSGGYRTKIGGIIGKTVGIPNGINCIVGRLA